MATRHAELIEKVETLKNMLVSRATGESAVGLDFGEIRAELLNETIVKDRLPRFVRTCRNLDELRSSHPRISSLDHCAQRK